MTTLPSDVHVTLTKLLSNARADLDEGDGDSASDRLATVETVAKNKVPKGHLRDRLLHGCAELETLTDTEPDVAAEYLRSMERLVDSANHR